MTFGIPNTEAIRAMATPYYNATIDQLGKTVEIIRPPFVAPTSSTEVDEWGKPTVVTVTPEPIEVQAYIYQLPEEARANFVSPGSDQTIPDWEALFKITAPVDVPGFTVRYRGVNYIPTSDAEDMGEQGIGWRVRLQSPEARGGVSQ